MDMEKKLMKKCSKNWRRLFDFNSGSMANFPSPIRNNFDSRPNKRNDRER